MTITDQLRQAIETCDETRYRIAKNTGISEASLCRFVWGEPMRGDNIDTLGKYFGLELVKRRRKRGRS